jgi:glycerol-3-phosphate dehydrogenase (NAD+)
MFFFPCLFSYFFALTYPSLASSLPPPSLLQAAVIRRGLQEMRRLCKLLDPNVHDATFFESCGVADLITTCYGGRNRKCAERFARAEGKVSWEDIEKEELGGQHLQGTHTAAKLHKVLERKRVLGDFPLFCTVYQIAFKGRHPGTLVKDFK